MLEILEQNGFKVVHLTDGAKLQDARSLVESGRANGINLNFVKNFPKSLEILRDLHELQNVSVNDYDHKISYDYSVIHSFSGLRYLSVYTTDRKEIDFSSFPLLESAAIYWRPKAASLFNCTNLRRLFLGRYSGHDIQNLSGLKKLEYLRLNTGSIRSLKGIEELHLLKELMLMLLTKLVDIRDIGSLQKLEYLRIDNCKNISDINVIRQLQVVRLEIVGSTPN